MALNIPTLTDFPPPPSVNDSINFRTKAVNHVTHLGTVFTPEMNAIVNQMNQITSGFDTVEPIAEWNVGTTYNFPTSVAGSDGHTYRCVGTNVTGVDPVGDNGDNWLQTSGGAEALAELAAHNVALDPHSGVLEPAISKNTGFNKNFGTTSGTVAQGNDSRFLPAYGAIGSYVFAVVFGYGYGRSISPGSLYAGYDIRPSGVSVSAVASTVRGVDFGWSNFSGTWRAHGYCAPGNTTTYSATLFQRIA